MSAGTSGRSVAVRVRYDIRRELGMRASSTPIRVDLRQHPYVQLGCREFNRPAATHGSRCQNSTASLRVTATITISNVRGEAARGREAGRHARSAAGRGPDGAEGTRAMRDAKYCTGVVRVRPERRPGPTRCGRRATSERRSACRTTSCWSIPDRRRLGQLADHAPDHRAQAPCSHAHPRESTQSVAWRSVGSTLLGRQCQFPRGASD